MNGLFTILVPKKGIKIQTFFRVFKNEKHLHGKKLNG